MNKKVTIVCPQCQETLDHVSINEKLDEAYNTLYDYFSCPFCGLILCKGYNKTLQYLDKIPKKVKEHDIDIAKTDNTENKMKFKCPVCKQAINYLYFEKDEDYITYSCPQCNHELVKGYIVALEVINKIRKEQD